MAAYGGYPDIVRLLIEAGADLEYKDVDGDTPLDLATNKGHTAVVLLIQDELTRRAIETG
jgi:ankyrin repeat protein